MQQISLSHTLPFVQEPLGMYVIVKPIYGIPVAKALQQISFFVDHYAALGFNNTILYERGTYIRHLQRDAATAKQLHHGILKVSWWLFVMEHMHKSYATSLTAHTAHALGSWNRICAYFKQRKVSG